MKKVSLIIVSLLIVFMIYGAYALENSTNDINGTADNNQMTVANNTSANGTNESIRQQMRDYRQGIQNEVDAAKNLTKRLRDERRQVLNETMQLRENIKDLREQIKEKHGWFNVGGMNIMISELNDTQKEIIAGKIDAKTGLNLTAEDIGNGTLGSILSAYMSNGRKALVKYMPDRASAIALSKLRAKCDNNCTIDLKEVGVGNNTRLAYEVDTQKDSTFLLFFHRKMPVKAQVDAETGQVIAVQRPWWAFLAREKNEDNNNSTVIDNTTVVGNSTVNASA